MDMGQFYCLHEEASEAYSDDYQDALTELLDCNACGFEFNWDKHMNCPRCGSNQDPQETRGYRGYDGR